MNPHIKHQRLESLLQEVLSEAFSQLSDSHINTLSVTGVICSKGKQSAEIFIEGTDIPQNERSALLKRLVKAQGVLREYVLSSTQWFRCPHFTFKFDDSLHQANTLDGIFEKIAQEAHDKKQKIEKCDVK